jgi:hypothetical protein
MSQLLGPVGKPPAAVSLPSLSAPGSPMATPAGDRVGRAGALWGLVLGILGVGGVVAGWLLGAFWWFDYDNNLLRAVLALPLAASIAGFTAGCVARARATVPATRALALAGPVLGTFGFVLVVSLAAAVMLRSS